MMKPVKSLDLQTNHFDCDMLVPNYQEIWINKTDEFYKTLLESCLGRPFNIETDKERFEIREYNNECGKRKVFVFDGVEVGEIKDTSSVDYTNIDHYSITSELKIEFIPYNVAE